MLYGIQEAKVLIVHAQSLFDFPRVISTEKSG